MPSAWQQKARDPICNAFFFLRVAEIIRKFNENTEFVMPLSPFAGMDLVRSALVAAGNRVAKQKGRSRRGVRRRRGGLK